MNKFQKQIQALEKRTPRKTNADLWRMFCKMRLQEGFRTKELFFNKPPESLQDGKGRIEKSKLTRETFNITQWRKLKADFEMWKKERRRL